jgi:beta-galactosidase
MNARLKGVVWLLLWVPWLVVGAPRTSVDLDGPWQFRTDPQDAGRAEQWYRASVPYPGSINVPGCWQAQGIGEPAGILRHHYAGAAWYRRMVAVPAEWRGRRIVLRIGGALRDIELYVNGVAAGRHSGMSAPFSFDVTSAVRTGSGNVFALRVAIPKGSPETADPRSQAGAEPTGMLNYIGNWGGIYGHMELEATSVLHISDVAVQPDTERMAARFRVAVAGAGERSQAGTLRVTVGQYTGGASIRIRGGEAATTEVEVAMPGARLWSPDHPFLYTAEIALEVDGARRDRVSQRFGLREITTRGDVLLLNGKPLYLRGFGDDNVEVLTGTPPASRQTYLSRLRLARSFGFNAVRFHSMTPVREYFEAADETGILVMAELPAAYTMYFLPHKDFLRHELESILRAHRNHPSFLSLALGNELNPEWLKEESKRKEFFETIAGFYRLAKTIDPGRLVLATDGVLVRPTDLASLYGGAAKDVPTVRHEFGDYYCSLPDSSLMGRFTGVMAPAWLEAKKRWVEQNGLAGAYPAYVANSERLQQLGRKYQIEKVRLDNGVTGYQYWLIVDYPGGTGEGDSWEEGWFNSFWEPKGITPAEGRELNSPVLPLIDAGPGDRSLWADAGRRLGVLVSNYGDEEIRKAKLKWRLLSDNRVLRSSELSAIDIPLGKVVRAGEIDILGPDENAARQLELVVELQAGGSAYANRWSFWSFPRSALLKHDERPVFSAMKWGAIQRWYPFVSERDREWDRRGVVLASAVGPRLMDYLEAGGSVLLFVPGPSGGLSYFPPRGGAIGTMILDHPALRGFPHGAFADLQFYNLEEGSGAVPLDVLPGQTEPIIGAIRTAAGWLSQKKDLVRAAQLLEARVGKGRLLATTLRVRENFDDAHPEAIYFFDRLLRYVLSDEFEPKITLSAEQVAALSRE